jgi:hypothetical protein
MAGSPVVMATTAALVAVRWLGAACQAFANCCGQVSC